MAEKREQEKKERKPLHIKRIWIVCGAVLAALIGVGIWMLTGKDDTGDSENVLYADSVGMLTGTGLGTQNRFSGTVESQDTLKISLTEGQKVKEIYVEKGQEVQPGTPLFQYDTEELAMTLEQGNLELERIANSIDSLNMQIAALAQEKNSAPSSEQLSYTTQIQSLQTDVKQEEYNYKVKELEVSRAKKNLESAAVNSTIFGIVQEINPEPSYDNYTGEKQAFMSILSTGKYRIKGRISEQNIGNLYEGMPVIVHSRVNEEEIWTGVVDSIDTEKPENSQSMMYYGMDSSQQATRYPFYVTLNTSDGLMLGQHVYIEPNLGQADDGMWLMSAYIVDADSHSPYVWLAGEDGKLEKREIKLGGYDEERDAWEVLGNLKATEYIVWPSDDCKKGAAVVKNDGTMGISGGMNLDDGAELDMNLDDGANPEDSMEPDDGVNPDSSAEPLMDELPGQDAADGAGTGEEG